VNKLRWSDEKAVSEWVECELKADRLRWLEAVDKRHANSPPLSTAGIYARVAADALAEAERGNMHLLVEMLDPNCQYNNPEPEERPLRSYLPPAAWQFIMDVLTGVRNPVTGRRKEDRHGKVTRKRGPSKRIVVSSLTRKFSPIGVYFEIVEKLRTQFPEQKKKDINKRALSITSERWKLDENTLANKLKKDAERKRHLARKQDPYSAK
jgi:hypothetical protein